MSNKQASKFCILPDMVNIELYYYKEELEDISDRLRIYNELINSCGQNKKRG